MQKTSNSLTEGSILTTLVRFAVPYLLANFVQALYSAVDLMIIGLSLIHISEPTRPY